MDVLFIIGTDRQSINRISESICNNLAKFFYHNPSQAANLSNTYIAESKIQDGLDNLKWRTKSNQEVNIEPFISYCKNAITDEKCLVLGDIAHTHVIPEWISACNSLNLKATILYVHQYNTHNPIGNTALLAIMHSATLNKQAYCIENPSDLSEKQLKIQLQAVLKSGEAIPNQIVDNLETAINVSDKPNQDIILLNDLLISSINSEWSYDLPSNTVLQILQKSTAAKSQLIDQGDYYTLIKVIYFEENTELTEIVKYNITGVRQSILFDLRTYSTIKAIQVIPCNSPLICRIKPITLITKSNKQVRPKFQVSGNRIDESTTIFESLTQLIDIELGTYRKAAKYLNLEIDVFSFSSKLAKVLTEYGKPSNIHTSKSLKPRPVDARVKSTQEIYRAININNEAIFLQGRVYNLGNPEISVQVGEHTIEIEADQIQSENEKQEILEFSKVIDSADVKDIDKQTNAIIRTQQGDQQIINHCNLIYKSVDDLIHLDVKYALYRHQQKDRDKSPHAETDICISIITPVFNVKPKWLKSCIDSVLAQTYPNWELCLYDDSSTNLETTAYLDLVSKIADPRIKLKRGSINKGISAASNLAISQATGDYIAFLDNDDELTPDALSTVVSYLEKHPDTNLIYSDEDKLDEGRRVGPYFKSDFDINLLRSNNYITHFTVVNSEIGSQLGWFREGYDGAQDHDLLLRIVDLVDHKTIRHIPKILYHWRKTSTSTAGNYKNKPYASNAGKKAIEDHLLRNNLSGKVSSGLWPGAYKIEKDITVKTTLSIIIEYSPSTFSTLLQSIISNTMYPNYELVIICRKEEEKEALNCLVSIDPSIETEFFFVKNEFDYTSCIKDFALSKGLMIALGKTAIDVTKGWLLSMLQLFEQNKVHSVQCKLVTIQNKIVRIGKGLGINPDWKLSFDSQVDGIHYYDMGVVKRTQPLEDLTYQLLNTNANNYHFDNLNDNICLYTPYTTITVVK